MRVEVRQKLVRERAAVVQEVLLEWDLIHRVVNCWQKWRCRQPADRGDTSLRVRPWLSALCDSMSTVWTPKDEWDGLVCR